MSALENPTALDAARWVVSLLTVRATVVLVVAVAALATLRRAPASARQAALVFTVAALLALPLLSGVLPRWELALLPPERPAAPTVIAFTAVGGVPAVRWPPPSISEPSQASEEAAPHLATLSSRSPRGEAGGAWSAVRAWPILVWVLLAWAGGVSAGLARLLFATRLVRRVARGASAISDPEWLRQLAEASAHLGLKRRVRLLSSSAVAVPVVFGYRDAVVLLPRDSSGWPEDRRRTFLLHELAHVRRHDCLTQTLAHVARLLYWPNPLAWWLVGRLRAETERACDDRVLLAGASASGYAAHLLAAARKLQQARQPLAALAVVERSRLEERLLALLDPGTRRGVLTGRSLAFGAIVSVVLVCSVAALQPVAWAVAAAGSALSTPPSATQPRTELPVVVAPDLEYQPLQTRRFREPSVSRAETVAPLEHARAQNAGPFPADALGPEAAPSVVTVDLAQMPGSVGQGVTKGPAPSVQTPTTSASTPNVPVIRISTELVQVDAVVTDKAGRPVVDLQPEDFMVFESGRRQRISHCVYVETGRGPTTGGAAALAAAPQTAEPRTLLLVVDDLNLAFGSIAKTRKLLTAFAQTGLGPAERVAIVKTSAVPGQLQLTSDPSAFRATVASLRYNMWNHSETPAELVFARANDYRRARSASISLDALKGTIDALRAVPGRKAVILFSEGFQILENLDSISFGDRPLDVLYQGTGVRAALRSLTDLANRASVVMYTIDPSGLAIDIPGPESWALASWGAAQTEVSPVSLSQQEGWFNRRGRQTSLVELSEQTGGFAVRNQNDLAQGLDRILADQAAYYLIGYEPESATFSAPAGRIRYQDVKVEVKRRGLTVRSRKGFYGVPDEVIAKAAPPLTN